MVASAPGQVGVGHTQWAEPASSTQDAPNSQSISAQVVGGEESEAQTQESLLAQEAPSLQQIYPPAKGPGAVPDLVLTCFTASRAQGTAIWTLPTFRPGYPRLTGTETSHLLTVVPHSTLGVTAAGWKAEGGG